MSRAEQENMSAMELSVLTDEDAALVGSWPSYTGEFAPLDYALREDGWFGMYPEGKESHRFAVRDAGNLIGFSLLVYITQEDAEILVALHPLHTGKGFGREVVLKTLNHAFGVLRLQCVYMTVRPHHKAIPLYESIGFRKTGAVSEKIIRGEKVSLVRMEIRRNDRA